MAADCLSPAKPSLLAVFRGFQFFFFVCVFHLRVQAHFLRVHLIVIFSSVVVFLRVCVCASNVDKDLCNSDYNVQTIMELQGLGFQKIDRLAHRNLAIRGTEYVTFLNS